jgi:hypothetical protein
MRWVQVLVQAVLCGAHCLHLPPDHARHDAKSVPRSIENGGMQLHSPCRRYTVQSPKRVAQARLSFFRNSHGQTFPDILRHRFEAISFLLTGRLPGAVTMSARIRAHVARTGSSISRQRSLGKLAQNVDLQIHTTFRRIVDQRTSRITNPSKKAEFWTICPVSGRRIRCSGSSLDECVAFRSLAEAMLPFWLATKTNLIAEITRLDFPADSGLTFWCE